MTRVQSVNRLTRSEVKQFLAHARRVLRTPELDILFAPAAAAQGRLLVVTPGRIGTAPQRNTVRRRLKALFQKNNFGQHGYDCGVIVKAPGVSLNSTHLETHLKTALAKVTHGHS